MAIIREFVAASVTQLVGVEREVATCVLAGAFNELPYGVVCHWLAMLRNEQVRRTGEAAAQSLQGAWFRASQRVRKGGAARDARP